MRDVCSPPCFVWAAITKLKGQYHVAIGFGPWGAVVGWMLKRLGKAQLVVYEDRDFEPGLVPDWLRSTYTAWLERDMVRRADLIISIGDKLASLRERQSGKKAHLIPTGVDWERFDPARQGRRRGTTLIYVGNLISWSGVELAVEAMPRILNAKPSVRLLIVGDGVPSYERYLRQLVERLGLQKSVAFLGRRPNEELPHLLHRADVGLANFQPTAYRKYAYPLKVIEYMAAGLPVIGTSNTETASILNRCQCGVAVPYEVEAFAHAVLGLFADPNHYQQMRDNGIRHSATMRWETLMAKELDLIGRTYEQLFGQRRRGNPAEQYRAGSSSL